MAIDDGNQVVRAGAALNGDAIEIIRQSLARIRFGAIQLTVHEGKLVQVDVTEKRRFQA
jgi:hypothetical protein